MVTVLQQSVDMETKLLCRIQQVYQLMSREKKWKVFEAYLSIISVLNELMNNLCLSP